MSRIRLLVTQEIRDHLRRAWFMRVGGLALLFASLATVTAQPDVERRNEIASRLLAERNADRQQARPLFGIQPEPSLRVIRTPSAASALVRGLDPVAPTYWEIEPEGLRAAYSGIEGLDIGEIGPAFDLEFVVRVLFGLLALMLGARGLARDQRTGALKALLAQPLSHRVIVFSKLVGAGVALAVLTIATTIVSIGVLSVTTGVEPQRLIASSIILCAAGILYLTAMLGLGVVIGQRSRSVESATALAGIVWLFTVLVPGPLFGLVGRALTSWDRPSLDARTTYQQAIRQVEESTGEWIRGMVGPTADVRTFEFAGESRRALESRWDAGFGAARRALDAAEADRSAQFRRSSQVVGWLSLTTPGTLFLQAATGGAGTGSVALADWTKVAERYQDQIEAQLFDRRPRLRVRVPGPLGVSLMTYDRDPAPTAEALPAFIPPSSGWQAKVAAARGAMLGLLVYAAGSWVLAIFTFGYRPSYSTSFSPARP